MHERIRVGEIKKTLQYNKDLAKGTKKIFFQHLRKEDEWPMYDSPIQSFGSAFKDSLPSWVLDENKSNREVFKDYIEKSLKKEKRGDLFAVEFGGPGSELFKGFTRKFFKKTIGVCLKDIRDDGTKTLDNINNHSVIEGDILEVQDNSTLNKVKENLGVNKVDLIISRMGGPLNLIDHDTAILDRIIRNWYEILNENGIIFIQFSHMNRLSKNDTNYDLIRQWWDEIKKRFPTIEIQLEENTIRIVKKKDSPEQLPPATQLFK